MSQPEAIIRSNEILAKVLFKQDPKIKLFRDFTPDAPGYGHVISMKAGPWFVGPVLISKYKHTRTVLEESKASILEAIRKS